jgi:catechol 2,3-dioxygenase-like lactoylglutathione lyase family enzyme
MSNYATVGSNRLKDATRFYDALLGLAGMAPVYDHPSGGRIYGAPDNRTFGVLAPFDGGTATAGNGSMIGFMMETPEQVRAFHAKALELGGLCDGPPGLRGPEDMGAYFAYVRDLDGNKLCAYCLGVNT